MAMSCTPNSVRASPTSTKSSTYTPLAELEALMLTVTERTDLLGDDFAIVHQFGHLELPPPSTPPGAPSTPPV